MAPQEKLAIWLLVQWLLAFAIHLVFTVSADQDHFHGYEYLVGIGFLIFAIPIGRAAKKAGRRDERDTLVALKAHRLALFGAVFAFVTLSVLAGFNKGMGAPVPNGAIISIVFGALALLEGARFYYYRRGV